MTACSLSQKAGAMAARFRPKVSVLRRMLGKPGRRLAAPARLVDVGDSQHARYEAGSSDGGHVLPPSEVSPASEGGVRRGPNRVGGCSGRCTTGAALPGQENALSKTQTASWGTRPLRGEHRFSRRPTGGIGDGLILADLACDPLPGLEAGLFRERSGRSAKVGMVVGKPKPSAHLKFNVWFQGRVLCQLRSESPLAAALAPSKW